MKEELLAPCGINCSVCRKYLALENDVKSKGIRMPYCASCRSGDKKCAFLKKRCNLLFNNKVRFCYECEDFPCKDLERIDTRYRNNYRMNLIENLNFIKNSTLSKFLEKEDEKWKCPKCGGVICCSAHACSEIGLKWFLFAFCDLGTVSDFALFMSSLPQPGFSNWQKFAERN